MFGRVLDLGRTSDLGPKFAVQMLGGQLGQQPRAQTTTELAQCARILGDEPFAVDFLLPNLIQLAGAKLETKAGHCAAIELRVCFV